MQQQLNTPRYTSDETHINNTISKSSLAVKLNVCRSTLIRFHRDFALEYFADYANDFPFINGVYKDDLPLNEYQAWVLTKLIFNYLKTPTLLIQLDLNRESIIESYTRQAFSSFKQLHK